MRSATILALLAATVGCRVGTLSPEEFDRQYPVGRLTTIASPGLDESLEALRESVGGRVRVTTLNFSEQRTHITAQNPRSPSEFDGYTYWKGDVVTSAVTMRGDDEQRYTARLFDLDSVPFDKLAGLALQAIKELPIEGAHVSRIGVDLDDGQLVIDVTLESQRRNGRVRFDAQGRLLSAKPD